MRITDKKTFITLSVSDKTSYNTTFNIMGLPLNLKCGYNSRDKKRWIIITDNIGNPLLTQTVMKKGRICDFNYIANRHDLNFFVTLIPKDGTKVFSDDYDYLEWSSDFDLYFVGSSQELVERLRVNGRGVRVGN